MTVEMEFVIPTSAIREVVKLEPGEANTQRTAERMLTLVELYLYRPDFVEDYLQAYRSANDDERSQLKTALFGEVDTLRLSNMFSSPKEIAEDALMLRQFEEEKGSQDAFIQTIFVKKVRARQTAKQT